ncbi:hypothetical protein Efla_003151 [Eimeria flavescens]
MLIIAESETERNGLLRLCCRLGAPKSGGPPPRSRALEAARLAASPPSQGCLWAGAFSALFLFLFSYLSPPIVTMVFTYQCSTPGFEVYMGRDKYENEDLIAHAFPEDVWFHVSELSSAHVYVRMPYGQTDFRCTRTSLDSPRLDKRLFVTLLSADYDTLPAEVIEEACQLTKHNSIEGCKQTEVTIVYTPASNLKKTASMDTGQVGFKQQNKVKFVQHVKRDRELVKRLEKTKTEVNINLEEKKLERDRRERNERKQQLQQQKLREQQELKEKQAALELRTYQALAKLKPAEEFKGDGTIASCRQIEEDFL